ncbi:hypothetical protein [Alteromonas sp. 14N.309.X.WAT.G.H12]|uniref:hypothetical protein n=1 Tax=Alteromonas sp. 14N.309.X.WAT.G.H12 TaxID=3120824 RepID=UPI002FCE7C22
MFITLNTYLEAEYKERCENTFVARAYRKQGGIKAFKESFYAVGNFTSYLKAISGSTLSISQTYHLARAYLVHGGRKTNEIPAILNSICLYYDITLPLAYGITSKEYWAERFPAHTEQDTKAALEPGQAISLIQ